MAEGEKRPDEIFEEEFSLRKTALKEAGWSDEWLIILDTSVRLQRKVLPWELIKGFLDDRIEKSQKSNNE